jgi:hypothetical protein
MSHLKSMSGFAIAFISALMLRPAARANAIPVYSTMLILGFARSIGFIAYQRGNGAILAA